MNRTAAAVISLSVLLGLSPFVADRILLEESTNFEMDMSASTVQSLGENRTRLGVDAGQNLDFGEIETGIRVTKYLEYRSEDRRLVDLEVTGNISERVNTTDRKIVAGDDRLGISFRSEEPGYFTGTARLKTYRPTGQLGERWMELKQFF